MFHHVFQVFSHMKSQFSDVKFKKRFQFSQNTYEIPLFFPEYMNPQVQDARRSRPRRSSGLGVSGFMGDTTKTRIGNDSNYYEDGWWCLMMLNDG